MPAAPADSSAVLERKIREAIGHIRDHPDDDLCLKTLAKRAGCTPHQFDRLFKKLASTSLHRHVRSLRLSQAATRLATSEDAVVGIALHAGFGSHASFTRAFRAQHGVSPSSYRARHQASRRPGAGPAGKESQYSVCLVKIPVRDFAKARAFYRDVLGFPETFAVEAYGWASYGLGNLPLGIYQVGKGGGDASPGEELAFHLSVADAPGLYRRLRARGVTFAVELTTSDDGGSFFMPRDPDGNTFKICQEQ